MTTCSNAYVAALLTKSLSWLPEAEVHRRNGYAADHGEQEDGLIFFAAPILYRGNRIVGSIGVSRLEDRIFLARAKMKIDLVNNFAAKLSKLFSRGPAEFATISPPYVSQNLE